MTELFELEPREAGSLIIEPSVAFDEAGTALHDRTRCVGCCRENTELLETTHSVTQ